ncbi:MAG: TIGR02453 family protein [Thermoplasmata archaeon]|nr:TIGR02453 family protein [Thermoplasmata archaeon]
MTERRAGQGGFTPDFFRFLRELAKNNHREWFNANKARYEASVRDPSFAFVRAVGPKLASVSRHLVADPRPVGGSVMRIYRDIRFSKDKSPYRTSVGIHFMHDGGTENDEHLPGFFLHLAPADSWVYAGVWQPEPPRLDKIRKAIVARATDWKKVRASIPPIEGESLKRPPPGYDATHPLIDDLKRKGFSAGLPVKDPEVSGPNFPDRFVVLCQKLDPLNRFLARAIDVAY